MSHFLDIDIPQTIVLSQLSYCSKLKEDLDDPNNFYLATYMGEKLSDYSVRNFYLNGQLRCR